MFACVSVRVCDGSVPCSCVYVRVWHAIQPSPCHDRVPLVLRVATRVNLSYVLRVKSGGEKRGPVFGGVEIGTMEPADHESDRSDDE